MPGKRKRVPPALHSELSEYSSLLRALNANDTLDVARRLTQPTPSKKRQKRTKQKAPDAEDEGTQYADEEEGTQYTGEGSSQLPAEVTPKPSHERKRKRDTWTRWPLLVKDLHVPEWGLDEEIDVLARQCLSNTSHPADADADSADSAASLPHLTQSASAFLSSLLALVAHHTPARPQSMQDRLNPIGWHAVLDIVASCGDVDATMLNNVKTRMEAIYGPYDSPATARIPIRAAAGARMRTALDQADDSLLSFARPRKRQPKRVVEDDIDSDDLDS
ncbi:hypothetical protein DFH06DRAFT_96741 [Mycena polygramma]|nr:hypothetical protein DFH06DRAFT_96741 [Mycena polygramma]